MLKLIIAKKKLNKNTQTDRESRFFLTLCSFTWEQRELGEVADEFKSGYFIKAEYIGDCGHPVYGGNGLRGYTERYTHDGEYALIGRQGALCGNMNFSTGKAYFTEHAIAVKANQNNDIYFLFILLSTMNLGQYSGQSAQPGLAAGKLLALQSGFPIKAEQAAIGDLFKTFDNLITCHQRKCVCLYDYHKQHFIVKTPVFPNTWEQREVEEICQIGTGKSNTQDKVDDGKYDFYVRSPIVEKSNRFLYDQEAVLTVGDGVGTGKVFHYVNGKYDLHCLFHPISTTQFTPMIPLIHAHDTGDTQ